MAREKAESGMTQAPPVIIEKYLATRGGIAPEIQRVLCRIYRGQVNTPAKWNEIITKRLNKPAD